MSKSNALYKEAIKQKFGIIPNKTELQPDAKFLWNLPDDMAHHFIRGFFDGDGCICFRNKNPLRGIIKFDGQSFNDSAIMRDYRDFIMEKAGLPLVKLNYIMKSNSCCFAWSGTGNVNTFGEYLYKDATVYLERKKERFNQTKVASATYQNNLTSKSIGVFFNKANQKFKSQIKINNKTKNLGSFDNEIDAAKAYDVEAIKLGRKTNF